MDVIVPAKLADIIITAMRESPRRADGDLTRVGAYRSGEIAVIVRLFLFAV
jgi:hypothetical protein